MMLSLCCRWKENSTLLGGLVFVTHHHLRPVLLESPVRMRLYPLTGLFALQVARLLKMSNEETQRYSEAPLQVKRQFSYLI
jgi:hypothetical protein